MTEIRTPRLRLLALDLRHLRLLRQQRHYLHEALQLQGDGLQLDAEMGKEMAQAIDYWLLNVESHPERYAWYTHWEIILRAENRSIGGIGFNGFPDPEGNVTVGYAIDLRYQNQGYATESLRYLSDWAGQEPRLRCISAELYQDNHASRRVLEKCDFRLERSIDQILIFQRPFAPLSSRSTDSKPGKAASL